MPQRGALVEWLERLGYGTESYCKVVSLRLGFTLRQLENSVNQAVNGYLFSNKGRQKAEKGEGWALLFISCAQDTVGL